MGTRKPLETGQRPLGSLLAEIERILGRYRQHQIVALRARLGIYGARTTLEEAGRLVGMTRERVRQVETQFFAHFLASPAAAGLMTRVERLRRARREPLFLERLRSEDRWFRGFSSNSEMMTVLLPLASNGLLGFIDTPEGAVVCNAAVPSWDDLLRAARAAVTSLPMGSSRASVGKTVLKTLKERGAPELLSLVLAAVESSVQYSASGQVIAFGSRGPAIVEAILHDSDRPLHYSEVARHWSERCGGAVEDFTAHAALQDSSSIYPLGRGVYGVAKHIPLEDDAARQLVADCELIVTRTGPNKQWHAYELLEALIAMGRLPSPLVDKYVIDACLRRSGDLQWLGRLTWALPHPKGITERIDVRDATAEALRRAGHPLREDDLRREIALARGLNDLRWIGRATEVVARTAPSTWGLVNRDFGLSRSQREQVTVAIWNHVRDTGRAVHISEIRGVVETMGIPDQVTPYMLMQLATIDGRMKLFYGSLLGLSEWTDARRPSPRTGPARRATLKHFA